MKEKAIVVDIDGVLLDVSLLYKEIENLGLDGQAKWNFFHENANNPKYAVKVHKFFNLVNMYVQAGYKIIVLTSRRDLIGKSTLHYLLNGDVKLDNLTEMVLRPANKEGYIDHIVLKDMEVEEMTLEVEEC